MWLHYICTESNWVPQLYGPYARCGLDKGVAITRGGGGSLHIVAMIGPGHCDEGTSSTALGRAFAELYISHQSFYVQGLGWLAECPNGLGVGTPCARMATALGHRHTGGGHTTTIGHPINTTEIAHMTRSAGRAEGAEAAPTGTQDPGTGAQHRARQSPPVEEPCSAFPSPDQEEVAWPAHRRVLESAV